MSDDIRELVNELQDDVRRLESQVDHLESKLEAEAESRSYLRTYIDELERRLADLEQDEDHPTFIG